MLLVAPLGAAPEEPTTADELAAGGHIALKPKNVRRWKFELPKEVWRPVGKGIDFASAGGPAFRVGLESAGLRIDKDADGEFDVTIEGDSGFVALEAGGDNPFRYGLRLRKTDAGWMYGPACSTRGTIGDTRITLIDANVNGRFGDVGEDAVIVGMGTAASFLGETMAVGNALYKVEIAADGRRVDYKPYTGPTGELDLQSRFDTKARLVHLVIGSKDGRHSFEVSNREGAMRVPAGLYTIQSGALGLGKSRVTIRQGRMRPIPVRKDKQKILAWGGPLSAEFSAQRGGGQVAFDPARIWYFGSAGEEYVDWTPLGKSPVFHVIDKKLKKEVATAIFAGSG
jgi:hypothetical protein